MNRNILAAIVLPLLLATTAVGQAPNHYGLKLGACIATLDWEYGGWRDNGIQNRLGLDACAFAEWFETPLFSLASELHYVQKGMSEDIPFTTEQYPDGTGEFISHSLRLNNLSLLVLPKVRLEGDALEGYAMVGPRFDILVSSSVVVQGREPLRTQLDLADEQLVSHFKNLQVGATFVIGVQLKSLLPIATGLEVRYSPNLQSAYSGNYWDITNRSFEILLTLGI